MLGIDEDYKLHWTHLVRRHHRVQVFGKRIVPRLRHITRYLLRPWLRKRLPWLRGTKRVFTP